MYSAFVSKVLYPAVELVERRHFLSILDWYNHCQYLPYEELKARQEEKLRQLIRHAYENVPFYRDKFDSVGLRPEEISVIEDLSKLPVTTRLEIRNNFPDRMVAKNIPRQRRVLKQTSGSTGTPLEFYLDATSWDYARASYLLFNQWAGIRPGERFVWLASLSRKLPVKTRLSHLLLRYSYISVADFTFQDMEVLVQRLARINPSLIGGFALHVFRLAQLAMKHDIEIRPRAVISTSATIPSRKVLEKAFCCPVFDRYGNEELNGYLAQNCVEGHSLHINTELCIFEVVDEWGKSVSPGMGLVQIT